MQVTALGPVSAPRRHKISTEAPDQHKWAAAMVFRWMLPGGPQPQSRRVAWVIQATAEEIGVLDSLVVELGAESRSELIATALETYLLPKSRRLVGCRAPANQR